MKKVLQSILLLATVTVMAACGSSETAGSETETAEVVELTTTSSTLNTSYENALPVSSQLGIGIIALDGSDNAVQEDQVSTLLFYWKALLNMTTNETVAEDEINALYSQIEDALTTSQLEAIAELQLTQDSMREYMGMGMGGGGGREMDEEMQATLEAMQESGEMPEMGDFGGGGGGNMGGGRTGGDGGMPGGDMGGGGMAGGGGDFTGATGGGLNEDEAAGGFVNRAMSGLDSNMIQVVITYLEGLSE